MIRLIVGCSFILLSCAAMAETASPNVVILLADDLGYGELGCQGNPQIPTPHIDSIAAGGVRCTQGYVTAPNCSPSRAGLLSGRVPTRFGYEFNPIGAQNEYSGTGIPRQERTIAELLHDRGYATALIGKWHLGGTADYHPQRHGFDEFFGFLHEGHFYVPPPWHGVTTFLRRRTLPTGGSGRWANNDLIYSTHMGHDEPPYDADNPILRSGQPVEESEYLTDAWTREAVDFIERHKSQPFLLLLAYNAVHSPLQAHNHYLSRFEQIDDMQRRIFAAMLANLDDSVGTVMKKLRDEQLLDRTLVFFLSDNGGPTRELTSSNLPLRGEKGQMYEGGVRVPFLVQWSGQLPGGVTYDDPISSMDILATASAAAGVPVTDVDGVDLVPFLTGRDLGVPHETLFWRQGSRTALRHGHWKLVNMRGKLQEPSWELYDLSTDVAEQLDVSQQQPERLEELRTLWESWNSEMRDPLF